MALLDSRAAVSANIGRGTQMQCEMAPSDSEDVGVLETDVLFDMFNLNSVSNSDTVYIYIYRSSIY